ncbi:MAG: peptidoglycan DD-metalloendopeptidase family protein [Clostridia bacterium]|nr:peptidoglycan DD-metalloendopeptidase family protein [Clostridia bacterium]
MLSKTQNLIKNNKVLTKIVSFVLVIVLSFVISFVSCGITFGLKVIYNGENIGTVSSGKVFEKAVTYITANTNHFKAVNAIQNASFRLTLTVADNLLNKEQLAEAIAENTDEISSANILYINGKPMAYTDIKNVHELIEESRCRYYIDGAENKSEFIDDVRLEKFFAYANRVDSDVDVENIILNLNVKTISKVSFESPIAFSTKTVKTAAQYIGYSKVTTKGIQGVAAKTELVETVNGKESSREVLKNEVLVEPVTQVVLTGTAVQMATPTEKANAQSAGFIMPLNSYDHISAYWGDGRNHKAIDFAGKRGQAIFAVQGGVVTCAAYRGNYGYLVEIDHGNGLKTRYAHCNALCVKAGQIVTQGQQIATMGNTGRSTGDHLHFEVLKNGTQVNPHPYLFK